MKIAPIILTPAIVLILTGCVTSNELAAVKTFGTSGSAFSTEAAAALAQVNQTALDRNIAEAASEKKSIKQSDFDGVLDADPKVKACEDALKALGDYASSLSGIANATYPSDIDSASSKLYSSLTSLKTDATTIAPAAANISSVDMGILATAVDGIGRAIAYQRQIDAIKTIMPQADPLVQTICNDMQPILSGLSSIYPAYLSDIATSRIVAYNADKDTLAYDERIARLNAISSYLQANKNAAQFLDKLSKSVKTLGAAHAGIIKSLTSNEISVADLTQLLGDLRGNAEQLKTFYNNLQKAQ